MKGWIFNNFWIKILSLILAVITWFYVDGELHKENPVSPKIYKSLSAEIRAEQPSAEKKPMNRGYIMETK